ncbi:MAG: uridine diphosphate-N-acetylglucosamine-binding protein YvcK [Chloroflexota bacterium]
MINWLRIGIGVKRWLVGLTIGSLLFGMGVTLICLWFLNTEAVYALLFDVDSPWFWVISILLVVLGALLSLYALSRIVDVVTAPFSREGEDLATEILHYQARHRGPKIVAIGGGTGLSNLLRGLTLYTNNITAIVTVADDGGSSGRLRREFGMLPPGDFRNNIAALSRDEALMAQLLQYRFGGSGRENSLSGHAFGNLLITALVGLTGSFEDALLATRKVLSLRGQVIPSTLTPINLIADVQIDGKLKKIEGESKIGDSHGIIYKIDVVPSDARGYPASIKSILSADLVILGPGSLFTSIIPNLLVKDIAKAVESTKGKVVYVCNVASQSGETESYTLSDHVTQLSKYLDANQIDFVLANNNIQDGKDQYGNLAIRVDQIEFDRIKLVQRDVIDTAKPWRHDAAKLARALVQLL